MKNKIKIIKDIFITVIIVVLLFIIFIAAGSFIKINKCNDNKDCKENFICDQKTCISKITCEEKSGDFCTTQYDPVCGENYKNYSNPCFACQEVGSYIKGEC